MIYRLLLLLIIYSTIAAPKHKPSTITTARVRVFVGNSEMFYSSGFASSRASTTSASGFAAQQSGVLKFTINVMKALQDQCPEVTVVNKPEAADYYLRVDNDGLLIVNTKLAAFNRNGEMTFAGITRNLPKNVKQFCQSLPR